MLLRASAARSAALVVGTPATNRRRDQPMWCVKRHPQNHHLKEKK
jgi:hypothetical protein